MNTRFARIAFFLAIAAALAAARTLRRIAGVAAVVAVSPRGGAERICRRSQNELQSERARERD